MAMKHLSHLNITGFHGQVALITTGHIGADGIMAAVAADTVIMDVGMVAEDIGVVEDLGEEVVVVDLVEEVAEEVVEEVAAAEVAADVKKSI
jgi:hypothetical protein